MRTGSEFLGTVIGSALLGFFVDRFFETTPWGMIFLIIVGFVSATMRAQKQMNTDDKKD